MVCIVLSQALILSVMREICLESFESKHHVRSQLTAASQQDCKWGTGAFYQKSCSRTSVLSKAYHEEISVERLSMLPTALRCLTASLRISRSSPLEVLCDPLQRLACQTRAPLQCTGCFHLPVVSLATHAILGRLQDSSKDGGSCSPMLKHELRQYCQQPVARSEDIFTYEGPLQKAVGSLKASVCPLNTP